jgi:two-component system, OmpR family, response regulator
MVQDRTAGHASAECDVLVVEDELDIQDIIAASLRAAGFRVATAANGEEALHQLAALAPRVLLLDMRMPVLDGRGFVSQARERGLNLPPLILMAATTEDYAKQWVAEIGAVGVLAKPFELEELAATVQRFLPAA